VGVSDRGFDDTIKQGLHKASETIKGITGIEVIIHTAIVDNNQITQYHVNMKLAFTFRSAKE
jgi:flavin-binding protein dodecin